MPQVNLLGEIKIIPSLLEPSSESQSLLDWIKSQDASTPLETIAASCQKSLESLEIQTIESLQREARAVIDKGGQSSMKEIKGLEERLFGLDQLLTESKKLVQEQYDLSQAFMQNQNRASDLKDSSIFPDLCQSHQHQLLVMQRNHTQLEDIRRRCVKAKEELSTNLHQRLKWVMYVQRSLFDSSNKVTIYGERLKRVCCQIQILEQIMDSKEVYLDCVKEVWRRRRFADAYLEVGY
jgi:RB1-inducible coiled-coil protein 1